MKFDLKLYNENRNIRYWNYLFKISFDFISKLKRNGIILEKTAQSGRITTVDSGISFWESSENKLLNKDL